MLPSAIPRTFRDQSQARNRRDSVKITWMSKYDRHSLSVYLSELKCAAARNKTNFKASFSPTNKSVKYPTMARIPAYFLFL